MDDLYPKERSNWKRRLHRVWSSDLTLEEAVGEMAVCLRCRDRPGVEFVGGESRPCSLCGGGGVMAGVTVEVVVASAVKAGLPPERTCESYIPDEARIRLECAKLRMGWTIAQRDAALRGTMHNDAGGAAGEAHGHHREGAGDARAGRRKGSDDRQ